jgi:sugar phosphate isomerase/epimerase
MPHPKIGLSMLYCLGLPFKQMVQRLFTVETSYIEIVDDGFHSLNKKRVTILNEIAKELQIKYTVHAPFADVNIASPSEAMQDATLKRLKQSMAFATGLDAQLWVFHTGNKTGISMFYPGEDWYRNIRGIQTLLEFADEYGLSIAMENLPRRFGFIMKTPEDFLRFYKETGLNDVGIALDVGHANLERETEKFLRELPEKIVHMHVSDNMGEDDQHLGIGHGKINWQRFAEILRGITYDKTVMIESVEHVEESLQELRQLLA